jgi:heat shock protein HslJ
MRNQRPAHGNWALCALVLAQVAAPSCSCSDSFGPPATPLPERLEGNCWKLLAVLDESGEAVWPEDPDDPLCSSEICFRADGSFSAKASCNRCGGTYRQGPADALALTNLQCTMLPCSCPSQYEGVLGGTYRHEIRDGRLLLYSTVNDRRVEAIHAPM